MRCADGRNHQLIIVSLICHEAKQQHKQYTKRILPWFVIPECNIRLDLVLNLMKLEERDPKGATLAYEQADAVIGSACERTIGRHRQWARRLVADTTLEASALLVELTPFAELPLVRAGVVGRLSVGAAWRRCLLPAAPVAAPAPRWASSAACSCATWWHAPAIRSPSH